MYLRLLKRVFCIFLGLACFFCLERLCHLATGGFSVLRIMHPLPESLESEDIPSHLSSILSQSFRYLDSGAQSYVFVSEDEKYVIKFFKFQHMRIPPWIRYLPLPKPLDHYRCCKIAKKERLIESVFASYQIAYQLFQKETGMVYVHLKTTPRSIPLHIIDNIGIHYFLEGNHLAFALQYKGTLLYEALKQDMDEKNSSQAKEKISSLLHLALLRCQKGIGDKDPDFRTNFGMIHGQVTQLDTGRFYIDPQEQDPKIYKDELYRITRSFREWISHTYPSLLSYLDDTLSEIQGDP
jgi:hypothetical protein